MPESLRTKWLRWGMNFVPAYRRTGARVIYIDKTLLEVRIKLPLTWRTRNHHGTLFGGALYAAVDPVYAMMLFLLLGKQNVYAWTKSSTIRFIKPGRTTLYAHFRLHDTDVATLAQRLLNEERVDIPFEIQLQDVNQLTYVEVAQIVSLRKRHTP
jgi:acyl-coenzyme A thioesterase PaaI-like protein